MSYEFGSLDNTPYKDHVVLVVDPAFGDSQFGNRFRNALKNENAELKVHEIITDMTPTNIQKAIYSCEKAIILVTDLKPYDGRKFQVDVCKEKAETVTHDHVIVINLTKERNCDIEEKVTAGLKVTIQSMNPEAIFKEINRKIMPLLAYNSACLNLKTNMGATMALNLYYGYLKVVIHEFVKFLRENEAFLKDGKTKQRVGSRCLIMIIPATLCAPPSLEEMDSRIKLNKEKEKVQISVEKGGKVRDYGLHIHSLDISGKQVDGTPQYYNFQAEVPSILLNLYDMCKEGLYIKPDQMMQEIVQFYHYLEDCLNKNPDCGRCVKLIFLDEAACAQFNNGRKNEKKRCDKLYDKLKEVIENDINGPEDLTGHKASRVLKPSYEISREHPGKALFINTLAGDTGKYEAWVFDILRHLGFESHSDVYSSYGQLYSPADRKAHSSSDLGCLALRWYEDNDDLLCEAQVFVCVILSYGDIGQICDNKGGKIDISRFIDMIGRSKTLKGVPKLFIVEASQEYSGVQEVDPVPPSTKPTGSSIAQCTDDSEPDPETGDLSHLSLGATSQSTSAPVEPSRQGAPDRMFSSNDVLVLWSGTPGFAQSTDAGLTFLQKLADSLSGDGQDCDFDNVLNKLIPAEDFQDVRDSDIAQDTDIIPLFREQPYLSSTLRKRLDFSQRKSSTH